MVSEEEIVNDGAFQGITIFKLRIATGNLTDVAPGRRRIRHQWVIHPFREFVRRGGDIVYRSESGVSTRIEVHYRVCLRWVADGAMVALGTTFGAPHRVLRHDIVEHEEGQL